MKKILSLTLASSMVASVFAGVAFAADPALDTQGKYDALKAKGIFEGVDGGAAGLDQNMTRAQYAKILTLLNGYSEDKAASSVYNDLVGAGWAEGYIGAVTKNKLMDGVEVGKFYPSADVTIEQLATVLVRNFDLPLSTDAVSGKVAGWAKEYVATAVKYGLVSTKSDYTVPAKRADLVDSTYAAWAVKQVTVKSTTILDSKTVEVLFSDDKKETVVLDTPLVTGQETVIAVPHNGFIYKATVKFDQAEVSSVTVTGAKKIAVKFNQPVDTTKVSATVAKGSVPINVSKSSFSDDKMTLNLELATKLTKGDYTVSVAGIAAANINKTISAEDEKVAKITINDKASFDRSNAAVIRTNYKVFNQYNEDVTSAYAGSLTPTVGKGTANITSTAGVMEITAPVGLTFSLDEKVNATLLHTASGTFASSLLTVSPVAKAATIKVEKLVNTVEADKQSLNVNSTASNFKLVIDAKDQYGNNVPASVLAQDVIVTVTNPTIASVAGGQNTPAFTEETIDGSKRTVLALANGYTGNVQNGSLLAGTTQVNIISRTTGDRATFDVVVADKAKVDTLTLTAPDVAAAGEKIEIPFTAVDQFGAAITKDITDGGSQESLLSLNVSGFTGTAVDAIYFTNDNVKGVSKLIVDTSGVTITQSTPVYINAVTATGKLASLTFTLQPNAKGTVVTGVTDLKKAVAIGGTTSVPFDKVTLLDQYNRAWKLNDTTLSGTNPYRVSVKTSDASIIQVVAGNTSTTEAFVADANRTVTLSAGNNKGTATITLKLQQYVDGQWKDVANSDYTTTVRAVEQKEISNYEIADIAKVYAKPATPANPAVTGDYSKSITVNGLLADGTKVALPVDNQSYYTVTVTGSTYLAYNAGKVSATSDINLGGTDKEKTFQAVVTGNTKDGAVSITKDFVVSNVAPVADKLELRTRTNATDATAGVTKEADGLISVTTAQLAAYRAQGGLNELVVDAVKVTDQYGVELTTAAKFKNIVPTFAANKNFGNINAVDKDSFNVNVITDNGKSLLFKVIVK
ncbi:S-layer homology domain-containing protein [Paenibacillus aurantius]|uniref:S-layer homology domain-containing protein n=1 Tax=Paenibacillus aurantius TaxID=2918900 RepID=A0AA96LDC3_9BACL|nr:S-layer homology domain-containing protein [Paenibacillus aurantius]WNQ11586.1 S-layer homology domain-containing protein [Paenibacillus aurantius]